MEHLIQPIPGPQCCRMQSRWLCSAGKKSLHCRALTSLSHTIFHAQLCHTHTHELTDTYIHTYVRTYVRTYMHTIFSHTFTHSLSPPPLSFLPSPSPLQPLKLSIGRSWLVGLSGPLIAFSSTRGLIQVRLQFAIICFENTNAMKCWLFLQFSMLQSWNILEYLGISWNILEYLGISWNIKSVPEVQLASRSVTVHNPGVTPADLSHAPLVFFLHWPLTEPR